MGYALPHWGRAATGVGTGQVGPCPLGVCGGRWGWALRCTASCDSFTLGLVRVAEGVATSYLRNPQYSPPQDVGCWDLKYQSALARFTKA